MIIWELNTFKSIMLKYNYRLIFQGPKKGVSAPFEAFSGLQMYAFLDIPSIPAKPNRNISCFISDGDVYWEKTWVFSEVHSCSPARLGFIQVKVIWCSAIVPYPHNCICVLIAVKWNFCNQNIVNVSLVLNIFGTEGE